MTSVNDANPLAVKIVSGGGGGGGGVVTQGAKDATAQNWLVDVQAMPAAARTTDAIAAALQTDALMSGLTVLTPKFAKIAVSASGVTQLVAAVGGKKLRVVSLFVVAAAAVTVKFQSHTTPTDLTGAMPSGANGGFVLPFNPLGWFESLIGEALDVNLGGAISVAGSLSYVEV